MTTVKTYVVANPRGIPKDSPIIGWDDADLRKKISKAEAIPEDRLRVNRLWFEGDAFVKPSGLKKEDVDLWIARGFLVALDG